MEYKNVIAIDAMGGDNAPAEIIKGAIEAINERADIKLRLFGDKDKIETELNKYTYNKEQIGITHTTEEYLECLDSGSRKPFFQNILLN